MQIGFSSASFFAKRSPEASPKEIARLGASLCEIFLNTTSEYDESFFDVLLDEVQAARLQVYSLHPMGTQFEPQLFSMLERPRRDAYVHFIKVLKGMQRLGSRYYVMHGLPNLGGAAKNVNYSRIAPILKEYCSIASDYGVHIAYENVSWCLFNTPDFVDGILNSCSNDALRFTLDIKQAARSGYSPDDFLCAMGDRLVNVHLCDYIMLPDGRVATKMIGEGSYDFAKLFSRLRANGYAGPAFIEVYSDLYHDFSQLAEARNYLSALSEC